MTVLSVVIPAHNEEAVIERCLRSLTQDQAASSLEIVVVANGCVDRTVELASRFPGVKVVQTPIASKHAAIVLGDETASHFPRAFVDADVEVSSTALVATATAMGDRSRVAAPALRVDLSDCPWSVRAYYSVWLALEWSTNAPVGSGVYVLSAAGRAHIGEFPDITNDDQFVHDSFPAHERLCVSEHEFVIRPARTLKALVRRRTRTLQGQRELRERVGPLPGQTSGPPLAALLRRHPRSAPDIAVFVAVTVLGRIRASRRSGDVSWGRDDTSRVAASAS